MNHSCPQGNNLLISLKALKVIDACDFILKRSQSSNICFQVYCLESGQCVDVNDYCNENWGSNSDNVERTSSEDGCNGRGECKVGQKVFLDLVDNVFSLPFLLQMCPLPEEIGQDGRFSSCLVDLHCPGEEICCDNQGRRELKQSSTIFCDISFKAIFTFEKIASRLARFRFQISM